MLTEMPRITEFVYMVRSKVLKDNVRKVIDRTESALFFVLRGKIKFIIGETEIIADQKHPLYIPAGSCHINLCLKDADLLFFNFFEQKPVDFTHVSPVDESTLVSIYNEISVLKDLPSPQNDACIMSALYRLVGLCMKNAVSEKSAILSPALEYISIHFNDPTLNAALLAEICHVSKIYLHKLFVDELGLPPFKYITRIRMERARLLLSGKCPVGLVAKQVGYGDIYAFSRAYKRYYHVSPSTELHAHDFSRK